MQALLKYIEAEQPRINTFLDQSVNQLDALVQPIVKHVLQAGGKRLRPLLTILTARALGMNPDDKLYYHACALEYLHSATLMHDDILDGAEMRRGQEAAHIMFGQTETILAGDVLLALGNKVMAETGDPELTQCISEAIMRTAAGEIEEIAHLRNPNLSEATYLSIITGKTAYLLQAASQCGALLAKADKSTVNAAVDFGLNLGIAFQLVDDALDYGVSAETAGKPVGADLQEGKLTLPMLYYLEQISADAKAEFADKFQNNTFTEAEIKALVAEVKNAGCDVKTRDEAGRYLALAADALALFPKNQETALLNDMLVYIQSREQ